MSEKIVLKDADVPGMADIGVYVEHGGYAGLRKALHELTPEQVTDMVKRSGLRGRGGAGFPTGVKWGFTPKNIWPHYLVCNADEGEPGTFKDRDIMVKVPHRLIEAVALTSYAIGAGRAFIYVRGEYAQAAHSLSLALAQAQQQGYVGMNILGSGFDLSITIHCGAGSYECGEETALLESLEGKRGMPRIKPPFPAVAGLYGKPTVINNVETLANTPAIVSNGPEWFAAIGTAKSAGTRIFCVSGHVNKPGNYELPMGVSLRELIYDYAGGVREGRALKAVFPGGSSSAVLRADQIDTALDFESLAAAGSSLGSAGVIVMDETTDMVRVALRLMHFYAHESCGKCTPCRIGTQRMVDIMERIVRSKGKPADLDRLTTLGQIMKAGSLCGLGQTAFNPVTSTIRSFPDEYAAYMKK
jgi:NADH-quinone oxidoreductase subunit F